MKKTILAVGIACATMMAVAQSNAAKDNSVQPAATRDIAAGQASGKHMHKPITITKSTEELQNQNVVHRDLSARETGSGMATGRTASDNSNAQPKAKGSMSGAQSNPMYQENANSGTNPLYQGSSRNATKTRSNIQNNRVATGDVDGDGAADSAIVKSKSNITNNRVAAGNVNGDGTPDAAGSPEPAPAQMKGDFSRGHQPDRKAPAAANSSAPRDAQSGMATGKRQHN